MTDKNSESKKLITVLFIHHTSLLGGASNALIDLIEDMISLQARAIVIIPSEGYVTNFLRDKGVKTYIIRFSRIANHAFQPLAFSIRSCARVLKALLLLPLTLREVNRIIREEDVDIVYINSAVSMLCGIMPRIQNIPIVVHLREFPAPNRIASLQALLLSVLSTKVICASRAISREVEDIIPHCETIQDWVDIDAWEPCNLTGLFSNHWNIPPNQICIGFVGQIHEKKGVFVFLQSALRLLSQDRDYYFLFVGGSANNYESSILKSRIDQSGFQKRIILTGWLKDVRSIMARMDVVVCPSLANEGFGKVQIEAGVLGKPVISSNLSPADEIILDEETGILVPPNAPVALAEAIDRLAQDPQLRRKLGDAARVRVQKTFARNVLCRRLSRKILNLARSAKYSY